MNNFIIFMAQYPLSVLLPASDRSLRDGLQGRYRFDLLANAWRVQTGQAGNRGRESGRRQGAPGQECQDGGRLLQVWWVERFFNVWCYFVLYFTSLFSLFLSLFSLFLCLFLSLLSLSLSLLSLSLSLSLSVSL